MGRRCRRYEEEIAAAAGGPLEPAVAEHVEGCPSCGELRAAALALSEKVDRSPAASDPQVAVALARDAIRRGEGRRPLLWTMPLLSASATAAALILYFGLAPMQQDETDRGAQGAASTALMVPRVPEASGLALPEELRAFSSAIVAPADEEGRP